ncbi:MAG: ATP-binding cassette domain-containing protein, partial [Bdellovibrionota bacterium]
SVRVLSGGEKSRVALGQVLLQKASCLILDEPTNHLDFQTVEALTQALQAFAGSLVVVSHDRSFIRRIGTKIFEIQNGRAATYPGTYDDYVWSLENGAFATLNSNQTTENKKSTPKISTEKGEPEKNNSREERKQIDRRLRQLETLTANLEKSLTGHQARLSALNEELTQNADAVTSAKIKEMGEIQHEIEKTEAQWIKATEEKDGLLK